MSDKKYHVVKVSTSGLGDAIKSVATGALYAQLCERILIVDWRKSLYSNAQENSFFELFELKNIDYERSIPASEKVHPNIWRGNLELSFDELYNEHHWSRWDRSSAIKTYSTDLSKLDYEDTITVSWDFDQLEKLLTSYNRFGNAKALLRYAVNKFLNVSPSIQRSVSEVMESLPKNHVGVHLRHTLEFAQNKGTITLNSYADALKAELKSADQLYFLACDNVQAQNYLTSAFPNAITIQKWFAEPGSALHLDPNCPDRLKNAIDALTDMLLLSKAQKMICNYDSSFAQVASLFADSDSQRVINVRSNSRRKRLRSVFGSLRKNP